ncbi:MAG: hypothetical protein JF606_26620 [Burkholderiales bacterium]|jgi:hypothetical protein|nr:hypothetical protein [Burkholderiales bacterium]
MPSEPLAPIQNVAAHAAGGEGQQIKASSRLTSVQTAGTSGTVTNTYPSPDENPSGLSVFRFNQAVATAFVNQGRAAAP